MQEGPTQSYLGSLLGLFIVLAPLHGTAVAQPRTTPATPPAAVALQPASEPNLDGLDAFITSVMQEW